MLGQPVSMIIPEVVGFKLTGELKEGTTATDLVLRVVEMLRQKGVVGKFVEFYGLGLGQLTLADRATIANMAPEYGATMGFFPIDEATIDYLQITGRPRQRIDLIRSYLQAQGLFGMPKAPSPYGKRKLKDMIQSKSSYMDNGFCAVPMIQEASPAGPSELFPRRASGGSDARPSVWSNVATSAVICWRYLS